MADVNLQRVTKMFDPYSFDELFWEEVHPRETYEETFHRLNKEFYNAVGRKRYKNYEAYRQSRRQRISECKKAN